MVGGTTMDEIEAFLGQHGPTMAAERAARAATRRGVALVVTAFVVGFGLGGAGVGLLMGGAW